MCIYSSWNKVHGLRARNTWWHFGDIKSCVESVWIMYDLQMKWIHCFSWDMRRGKSYHQKSMIWPSLPIDSWRGFLISFLTLHGMQDNKYTCMEFQLAPISTSSVKGRSQSTLVSFSQQICTMRFDCCDNKSAACTPKKSWLHWGRMSYWFGRK